MREEIAKNYILIDSDGKITPYTYDLISECATVVAKNEPNYLFKDKQLYLDKNKSRYSIKIDNNTTYSWLYDNNNTINYMHIDSNKLDISFQAFDNVGVFGDFDKNVNITLYQSDSKVYI